MDWFRMKSLAFLDPRILEVSLSAEMLFYRSVMLDAGMDSNGRVDDNALVTITRKLRRPHRAVVDELLHAGLWRTSDVPVTSLSRTSEGGSDVPVTSLSCTSEGGSGVRPAYVIRALSDFKLSASGTSGVPLKGSPKRDEQAKHGEPRASAAARAPAPARAPARDAPPRSKPEERDASDRTPSGSVRSEAARQDAPRDAGGATRPAAPSPAPAGVVGSEDDSDLGPDLPEGVDPKEWIRKVNANSSRRTGKNGLASRANWLPDQTPSKHAENMAALEGLVKKFSVDE
jgi:hypothetical protein